MHFNILRTFVIYLFTSNNYHVSTASTITFTSTSDTIKPLLTPSLTLTCSLNDSVTSSSGGLVGRRDVTQTADDVKFVTSAVVMRNSGEHVASVTQVSPPTALVDLGNLKVTGQIAAGGHANLTLTWTYPDDRQAGNYVCEVNGMTSEGHNVVFKSRLEIGVTQPTMSDLIHHIHDQDVRIHSAELKNQQLDHDLATLQAESRAKDDQMMQLLNASRHIETGGQNCGNSASWTQGSQGRYTDVRVNFKHAYSSPPLVYLAVRYLYADNDDKAMYYSVMTSHVDQAGFSLRCYRLQTSSHITDLHVNWISFAH